MELAVKVLLREGRVDVVVRRSHVHHGFHRAADLLLFSIVHEFPLRG